MPAEALIALAALLLQQGVTVTAAEDGRCFRAGKEDYCLAGIATPAELSLSTATTDLSLRSRAALEQAVLGKPVTLEPAGKPDRWGRVPVIAIAGDGSAVQETLLRYGHVALLPDTVPADRLDAFRAAQLTAQVTGRGLWSREATRILRAGEAGNAIGESRYIRGRVRYVQDTETVSYLNFGPDYRTDFTIMIPGWLRGQMAAAGRAPAGFDDAYVEVFGLVHNENGPAVELTSGAAIRIIPVD